MALQHSLQLVQDGQTFTLPHQSVNGWGPYWEGARPWERQLPAIEAILEEAGIWRLSAKSASLQVFIEVECAYHICHNELNRNKKLFCSYYREKPPIDLKLFKRLVQESAYLHVTQLSHSVWKHSMDLLLRTSRTHSSNITMEVKCKDSP